MAIRYSGKYESKNHQIVAELRASAGAAPPIDPAMQLKKRIAQTATLMALLYGGDWRGGLPPAAGFFFIFRRPRTRR